MKLRNTLEPPAFTALFRLHPPVGFAVPEHPVGIPLFCADYDLTTTLEATPYARLCALPGFSRWSRALVWPTCFIGATITEYAPLPSDLSASELVARILVERVPGQPLTVLKDLPCASPLLSADDNAYADEVTREASRSGALVLEGQALAYVPLSPAHTTDAYLARLSASRRKNLRRKLRFRDQLEVESVPLGDERFFDEAFLARLYVLYRAVYDQSETHFDLLTPEFFRALLQARDFEGLVVFYHHRDELAGYNICLIHNGMLVDKYVGFAYPLARQCHLYFISWFVNLELARDRGLHTYVAGWTDPTVKAALGADFTFTRHVVWVRNPLLRRVLGRLRHLFEADAHTLAGG